MPLLTRKQQFSRPLWNVPIPRNRFFTGRESYLADLENGLRAGSPVALTGMGGAGKTQIAAHFAYEHRDDYTAVIWASAVSEAALVSDFAAIAGLLNLPQRDENDQALAATAVIRWLEANERWLLILDNADNLASVHGFIPPGANGHTLLTTQARATGELWAVEVLDMLPEVGALFLLRRAKIINADAPLTSAADSARATAMEVSKELGGLPLALDQAGAYVEETGCGLASYHSLYRQCRAELLKKRGGLNPHHPESVATTFALSFDKVAAASPAAADLLRLCAFLHPDAIPEELFSGGVAELGPNLGAVAADPLRLDAALAEILKYSLLRRDGQAKTMISHRLVQAVIQDRLTEAEICQWAERAVRAVNRAFPAVEFANWPLCERLVPHALACASLVGAYSLEFNEAGRLLNQAGTYLYHRARFSDAEALEQRALVIDEKALGPNHPEVATTLNNLAMLYQAQGKDAEAEPLLRRAIAIREKTLGADHPDMALGLNNLAELYRGQEKYSQAEPLYQRALALDEKALGPDHPDVARDVNNLALLYGNQGKHAQAVTLCLQALAILEKAFGPEHPNVARTLNNLAELYSAQGKYAQAEPLYLRALAIDEKVLGPSHPEVATDLNNLALHYGTQGKYTQAEPLLQRALMIKEKALGPDHSSVATILKNHARLLREQKRGAAARELEARAEAIRAAHSKNNPPK